MEIKIGYETGTGKEVRIRPAHLVVTGITQESGKTTTLQALIDRGKFKAIIFKTKIGERGISGGAIIPPYYKEEFDWEYASEMLEASRKEKLKFERSWIIKYSKTAKNVLEFKANIDKALADDVSGAKKMRELEKSVLITLQAYLEKILPELLYSPFSSTLDLHNGINIMDLESFKEETQGLIIRSVLTEVLRHHKNTICVIPESWKFIPERLGSPVKRPAEAFIRQGATNKNYLWLDSQDVTSVSKSILKQVSNWILGYQREVNEIKRTLDQIPLPKRQKPKPEDIASLKLGHFFVATSQFTKEVYVQPAWVDDETAREIALGNKRVEDLEQPQASIPSFTQVPVEEVSISPLHKPTGRVSFDLTPIKKEITELRNDFFNKIQEQQQAITKVYSELFNLKNQQSDTDIDEIVGKVLQKMPLGNGNGIPVDEISGIKKQIERINGALGGLKAGSRTYEVAPLEKIQKDFLEEAKSKILADVENLSDNAKRMLKYLETRGKGIKSLELEGKCFFMKHSGAATKKVSESSISLRSIGVARKDTAGYHYGELKKRIQDMLGTHKATEQETETVYNHILSELI